MSSDPRHVLTARLRLDAVSEADLDELFALSSDPAVWLHLPSGRHASRTQTEEQLQTFRTSWDRFGLGYWTVRSHDGSFLGVGGAAVPREVAWNLYYRLTPDAQGHGFATELVAAARAEAARLRPDLPVTAFLLEHNVGSRHVAERAGLRLTWRGPDAGNPDPDAVRLVYADRELDAATLKVLTAT